MTEHGRLEDGVMKRKNPYTEQEKQAIQAIMDVCDRDLRLTRYRQTLLWSISDRWLELASWRRNVKRWRAKHEEWNDHEYPGTRQLCSECEEPTLRCEDDSLYFGDEGPLCIDCFKMYETTESVQGGVIR